MIPESGDKEHGGCWAEPRLESAWFYRLGPGLFGASVEDGVGPLFGLSVRDSVGQTASGRRLGYRSGLLVGASVGDSVGLLVGALFENGVYGK